MAFQGTLLCAALIGFFYSANSSDTCDPIYRKMRHCLSDGPLQLECEADFFVMVDTVQLHWSAPSSETCPPPDDVVGCAITDVDIIDECNGKEKSCTADISTVPDACGTSGNNFVQVFYKCEPYHNRGKSARAQPLCDNHNLGPYDGVLAQIDSVPLAFASAFMRDSPCYCEVKIPPGTEMIAKMIFKATSPKNTNSPCDQHVEMTNPSGGDPFQFCEVEDKIVSLPCSDEERTLYVHYETTSIAINVAFVMYIRVADTAQLTIECGLIWPPPTIAPSVPAIDTTIPPVAVESTAAPPVPPVVTNPPVEPPTEPSDNNNQDATTRNNNGNFANDKTTLDDGTMDITPTTAADDANAQGSNGTDWGRLWPIILICCLLAALFLLIACCIMCCRHRRELGEEDKASDYSDNQSHHTFVTELYVEGDMKSRLFLDAGKNPMPRYSQHLNY